MIDQVQLVKTAQSILMPALVGALGTGALTGYMSSNADVRNELPSDRRKRILKNALIGSALGGTTAAALPYGLGMLGEQVGSPQPDQPAQGWSGVSDRFWNLAKNNPVSNVAKYNPLPTAVGTYGASRWWRMANKDKQNAQKELLKQIQARGGKINVGAGINVSDAEGIGSLLKGRDPLVTNQLLKQLTSETESNITRSNAQFYRPQLTTHLKNVLNKLQLLQEAGLKGFRLGDLRKNIPTDVLTQHLRDQGIFKTGPGKWISPSSLLAGGASVVDVAGRKLKSFGDVGRTVGQGIQNLNRSGIEQYLKRVRPQMWQQGLRSGLVGGTIPRLTALLGSTYLANRLENAIIGPSK